MFHVRRTYKTKPGQARKVATLVHGDDYVPVGSDSDLKWFKEKLENEVEIKTTIVGAGEGMSEVVCVLNRVIRRTSRGGSMKQTSAMVKLL